MLRSARKSIWLIIPKTVPEKKNTLSKTSAGSSKQAG
jgi:hypothetical protein